LICSAYTTFIEEKKSQKYLFINFIGMATASIVPFPPIVSHACHSAVIRIQGLKDTLSTAKAIFVEELNLYFELGPKLRKTIYGEVLFGFELESIEGDELFRRKDHRVAIKVYNLQQVKHSSVAAENPENEIAAMFYLRSHPNVISLVCCCQDSAHLYAIMPYIEGEELFDYIDVRRHGPLDEIEAKRFFFELISGLKHIHSYQVTHRDMSLENTLITYPSLQTPELRTVIIDFGMAIRLEPNTASSSSSTPLSMRFQSCCGKKRYIAPELMNKSSIVYPMAADVWAAGVMLFTVLAGCPPFDMALPTDCRYRVIASGRLPRLLQEWNVLLSSPAIDLLTGLLRVNPLDRLTPQQILEHPWFSTES
jgi:5'-AMP-activated protein kinase, catalytic alpha subunit